MDVLPDDLVRKCLLGVPYKSHDDLKAVCRDWEAMVSNPNFYADRKISGTSEQLICLVRRFVSHPFYAITVYDPVEGTWETLAPIDDPKCPGVPIRCQCVPVNRKLVVIGGYTSHGNRAMKNVYIYDFVSATWSRGADMPTARFSFASCVSSSTEVIYVAGGINDSSNGPMAAAEAYNVKEDKWEILPPMAQPRSYGCHGVFMEGKFMVISRRGEVSEPSAEVFDPSARTWRTCEDICISLRGNPWERVEVATSSSDLYCFIKRDVMKYNAEKNVWTSVATLPQDIHSPVPLTQWRDSPVPLTQWLLFSEIMEYNAEKNVWTAVATLPRDIHSPVRVTQWRHSLFARGFDVRTCKRVYYLFNPSTGQSIEVNSDGGGDLAICATTIEI